jgi:hypothetical protein
MLILIENSTTNRQYLAPLPVVIPQGQTVTTDFYGTIDRSPGNYSVSLLYDAHNERSHFKTANAVQLGTAITAQIKNTPALGSIAATNPQFSNAGAVYAENVSFNTTISKTGDYYDGNVQALIMRNNGQGSLVSAAILENKYIVMDVGTNSKSFTFSGTLFDLATGDYYAMLNNGDWLGTGSKYTQFHLISPNSKLENDIEAEGIVLFYSPGSELLHIHSGLPIEKLSVISGNGKTVIHKPFIAQKECTVNISALPKGLYMVQATTLLGTKTLKYIKK